MAIFDWTGISYPFRIENGSLAKSSSILNAKDGSSDHISESIASIISTGSGEWLTKPDFGSKFNDIIFNNLNDDFDTYIIHNLTEAIENQDKRVIVKDISIEHEDEGLVRVTVKWDINPDIVQNYENPNGGYEVSVDTYVDSDSYEDDNEEWDGE